MKIIAAAVWATMLAAGTVLAEEREITVEAMAPSVVKTVPECGDMKVDPTLKEITVTFSKDMKTERMWSICQTSSEHFPKGRGDIHYKDERTCVFPVKLEPGKTYVLWFNRGKYNSFRDTDNHPAIPYQLVFKTKDK